MAKNNKSYKANKLLPAVAMLTVSAISLSTATYAWFTMSKEVEVKNIQMTATTPEDIQISLGKIVANTAMETSTSSESICLAKSTGFLSTSSGNVVAPVVDYDWSNIADISAYYAFGKLIPASSNKGDDIFFTPDASGVGRTMKSGFKFYQAAEGLTAQTLGTGKANATAHPYTSADDKLTGTNDNGWAKGGEGNYTASTAWNVTNDDGYYVDIPVWLRTTSLNNQPIYVTGYVTDRTRDGDGDGDASDTDDLYKAVRVAILGTETDTNAGTTVGKGTGLLVLKDGGNSPTDANATFYTTKPNMISEFGVLDSDNYSGTGNNNRSKTDALGRDSNNQNGKIYGVNGLIHTNEPTYAEATVANNSINDGSQVVVNIPGAADASNPGTPKKLIIRVWLEGEDGNCWNENANQDWNIALKFTKDPLVAQSGGGGT